MIDNNISIDKKDRTLKDYNLQEESNNSFTFLKDFEDELDKQIDNIKEHKFYFETVLKQKQQEQAEMERTKVHNLDLFSPLYSKEHDSSELNIEIDNIIQKIEELTSVENQLNLKKENINRTLQLINHLNGITITNADKEVIEHKKMNEKGLSILEAQEVERQRIARDLHDSTVQNLTSLVHKAELCNKLIDIDSIRAKLELTMMSHTLKTVINDMRGVIYNLKPMTIEDLGLTATIERYAKQLMSTNNITVFVHANEETKDILPVINLTLFRIIQEACCNVLKHAKASMISIDINYKEQNVTVSIKDNGIGFNLNKYYNATEPSSSFGLSIIKERISLLSGNLDVQSETGKGTIVIVSAPLTIYEGDKNE